MKCDNLQRYSVDIDYVPNDDGAYMDADEVNEAIAELKQKLAEKDKEIALLKERICNGDVSRSTWIDDCFDKDEEIDELKKKLMPCLNGDCILTCEVVEKYGKENAELKQTIDELVGAKKSAEQILKNLLDCGLIKEWYFNGKFNAVLKADDPHLQIAELKQKLEDVNELVKTARQMLEDAKATHYAEMVDAGMRERKLRRALWLARAQAADGFATISRWTDYEDLHPDTKMGYSKWFKNFMHAKALCKAKVEEYK